MMSAADIRLSKRETVELHKDDVVRGLPPSENKKFYPALDGLRAVAVLMVFCQHYFTTANAGTKYGWTGVDFFFVLSGFLITGILFDTQDSLHRFRNFYVRRTLRIFPLYYAVLLVTLLLTPLMHWDWRPAHLMLPLYLDNYSRLIWLNDWIRSSMVIDHLVSLRFQTALLFGHFWSLAVEEQFYLVWPLIVFLVRDRVRLIQLCFMVCGLCLLGRILCAVYVPQRYLNAELLYRVTPLRADALLLGGALALMMRGPAEKKLREWMWVALWLWMGGFAIFEIGYRLLYHHFFHPSADSMGLEMVGYTAIDLLAAIVILIVIHPKGFLFRALTLKPLRWLGQISYGFYVFHDLPRLLYSHLAQHMVSGSPGRLELMTAVIGFPATLAISYLSFRFFESPFLRLKEKFGA
jgi:peptidoglycan/LPS O-acetylase OafA/YrhL